jgi:hypothetical protein
MQPGNEGENGGFVWEFADFAETNRVPDYLDWWRVVLGNAAPKVFGAASSGTVSGTGGGGSGTRTRFVNFLLLDRVCCGRPCARLQELAARRRLNWQAGRLQAVRGGPDRANF